MIQVLIHLQMTRWSTLDPCFGWWPCTSRSNKTIFLFLKMQRLFGFTSSESDDSNYDNLSQTRACTLPAMGCEVELGLTINWTSQKWTESHTHTTHWVEMYSTTKEPKIPNVDECMHSVSSKLITKTFHYLGPLLVQMQKSASLEEQR